MNKRLFHDNHRALSDIKADENGYKMLRRYHREMDWFEADPGRGRCLKLLSELCYRLKNAGVVISPGYGFLTGSLLMKLAGVHSVNPVKWDLPFERFAAHLYPGCTVPLEIGTGGMDVVRWFLSELGGILYRETEPGVFHLDFLDGDEFDSASLKIITYSELDRFPRTVRDGWKALDEASLRLFGRGTTGGSLWFETDRMREWLTEFGPESMSDLVLLRALCYPGRIALYPEVLRRRLHPETIPSTGDARADRILRDTYGVLVYQSQACLLKGEGLPVPEPDYDLALKGHEVARTMLSVEALWPRRMTTSLR